MASRSPHVAAWKQRLRESLTTEARSTAALAARTAVPHGSAHKLLTELHLERVAVKSVMPRDRAGGHPASGWRLREAVARVALVLVFFVAGALAGRLAGEADNAASLRRGDWRSSEDQVDFIGLPTLRRPIDCECQPMDYGWNHYAVQL
jgi:hypothetical protein